MNLKIKILIFIDWFYPGYKAGGPIQSLTNLVLALENRYEISVITSAYDHNAVISYPGINLNTWNAITIPGRNKCMHVFYADGYLNKETYIEIFAFVKPDIVYFNNIYSGDYFRLPLKILKGISSKAKLVICPRGMLQKGALEVKRFKKQTYLVYLRYSGMLNKAFWHATNEEEATDIAKVFSKNQGVIVASNIPKSPVPSVDCSNKLPGTFRLVYLSLITVKKNLLLLLQVLQQCDEGIKLDIYGPITDSSYWQQCELIIKLMPERVCYKGDVKPAAVQDTIGKYDALVLLTKGENFGHALYEGLSVGRPIITSHFTPWDDLIVKKAGWNVRIDEKKECVELLKKLVGKTKVQWKEYCHGAHKVALDYFKGLDTMENYNQLF